MEGDSLNEFIELVGEFGVDDEGFKAMRDEEACERDLVSFGGFHEDDCWKEVLRKKKKFLEVLKCMRKFI